MSLPRNGVELGESGIAANWAGVGYQSLKAIIEIYDQTIMLNRYENNKEVSSYEVSAKSLASALSGKRLSTGLLPPYTLFAGNDGGDERIAIMIPSGRRTINVWQGVKMISIEIPLPHLVLLGSGSNYWILACKKSWPEKGTELYRAPLANVYSDGRICRGSVPFPSANIESIEKVAKLFFQSNFNRDLMERKSKKHKSDIYKLYDEITGDDKYPMDDLVPAGLTIGELMNANPAS